MKKVAGGGLVIFKRVFNITKMSNIFFTNFGFRGTWAELKKTYPHSNFEVVDIDGIAPQYRRSYTPPNCRTVRLRSLSVMSKDPSVLYSMLQEKPEQFRVVEIGL